MVCPLCGGPLHLVTDGYLGRSTPFATPSGQIVYRDVTTLGYYYACSSCEHCVSTADAQKGETRVDCAGDR